MKAKIRAKIMGIERNATFEGAPNTDVVGLTKLQLVSTSGKVETTLNNAQLVTLSADLFLKEMIANGMKIGATITITVSDEEENKE